jgi:hypothetical protein
MKYHLLAMTLVGIISASVSAENNRADYDLDDDGLIEINDLQDLNDIRNSPTGSMLYGSNYGCPATGCFGFELTKDLDFDTSGDGVFNAADSFWDGGAGWLAIPEFNAVLEGNGHVIKNLTINRADLSYQGLFSRTQGASIRQLGIQNASIFARIYLGTLIGSATNTKIEAVFATGKVVASGGLSILGGLVGTTAYSEENQLEISNSFSFVDFGGPGYYIGGMVGQASGPVAIRSSLAINQRVETGFVTSYSMTGTASAKSVVTNSYWYVSSSRGETLVDSYALTLPQLECPTTADDVYCMSEITLYKGWSDEKDADGMSYWDFGNVIELPGLVLKGRLHRFDVEMQQIASSSSSSSSSSSVWSSSVSSATRSPASVPSSLRSSSSSSRSVSSCMGRSPASVPGSVSSRSSSSTSSCWNWTAGPNPGVPSSSSSSSSSKKKASSSSSSSKKKKPKHYH